MTQLEFDMKVSGIRLQLMRDLDIKLSKQAAARQNTNDMISSMRSDLAVTLENLEKEYRMKKMSAELEIDELRRERMRSVEENDTDTRKDEVEKYVQHFSND